MKSITQNQNAKRKRKLQQRIARQQRQLERRLDHRLPEDVSQPMFKATSHHAPEHGWIKSI